MIVKSYIADDMQTAMNLIKVDLGPHALIIDQQTLPHKGFFNRFKKKQIKVIAALEQSTSDSQVKQKTMLTIDKKLQPTESFKVDDDFLSSIGYGHSKQEGQSKPTNDLAEQHHSNESLASEVKELKSLITTLSRTTQTEEINEQRLEDMVSQRLEDYDFCATFKEQFTMHLKTLQEEKDALVEVSEQDLASFVKSEVGQLISIDNHETAKIQVLVGPPGVGKTTTIAKIASNEMLTHQAKVGLITVDTYRIGAVEQLKTYASILNIPLRVVHTKKEMKEAIEELSDCDRIIIDSAGRTHKDTENLAELRSLLDVVGPCRCYLVLSMSTKYRQLEQIMKRYQVMNYDHLILTKLDECERNENILNVCYTLNYPISYLCTGQEVPMDIETPSFERLVSLILGGERNE